MGHVPVRAYWAAVGSNVLALGILLRGIVSPLRREEQLLAVMLTAVSTACWVSYFSKRRK
jgi:hypothetical protein